MAIPLFVQWYDISLSNNFMYAQDEPMAMHCDNQTTMYFASSPILLSTLTNSLAMIKKIYISFTSFKNHLDEMFIRALVFTQIITSFTKLGILTYGLFFSMPWCSAYFSPVVYVHSIKMWKLCCLVNSLSPCKNI